MEYSCIIIEDEQPAQEKLAGFITEVPFLKLVKILDNAVEAGAFLSENKIDLIFLDIELGRLSGMEFLRTLKNPPGVIITTAYESYALEGYEFNVIDYLLKPYSFERFMKAVNSFQQSAGHKDSEKGDYIFVKTEYRIEKIDLSDILYIEGMKDYLRIICASNKIMTLMSFARIMEKLPSERFFRVHNSYIVSLDKIEYIERDRIRIGDALIPVSKRNRKEFYQKIGQNLIR